MPFFKTALASLLLLHSNFVNAGPCADIDELGYPSLDNYNFDISMEANNCEYEVEFTFQHYDENPIISPSEFETKCFANPPAINPDTDLPYFAFNWSYQQVPNRVKKVTGIDHISIDFNACGHPPFGVFTVPHYDVHIYRESPEFRTCMTCQKIPFTPVCDPGAQDSSALWDILTEDGAVIKLEDNFSVQPANMPDGFTVPPGDVVPLMGAHAWNRAQEPESAVQWTEPIWLQGSNDADIIFIEPMIPYSWMSGDSDAQWSQDLEYVSQTISTLPTSVEVTYTAQSKEVKIKLKGKSALGNCKDSDSEE